MANAELTQQVTEPSRLATWFWPAFDFSRRFFLTLASLPFIVLPAMLPLSSLLLMLPAAIPDETIITESHQRGSAIRNLGARLFALGVGLASLVAILLPSHELAVRLGLTGIQKWVAIAVTAYLLDLVILAAVGNVPLRYNFRNLMVRWRITLLTAIAFTVVVALLTVMLAFVVGMYRVTEESGQPGNILILGDGSTDEVFSFLAYSDVDKIEVERCVLDEDDRPLAEPIGVKTITLGGRPRYMTSKETYAISIQTVPGREKKRFVQVRGVVEPELAALVHDLKLKTGVWFSDAGVRTPPGEKPGERDQVEAVLGAGVAREFGSTVGKPTLEVGDTFELSDRTWVVVGIADSDGTTFGSEVWAKQSIVAKLFSKNGYNSMVLRIDDRGTRAEVSRRAAEMAFHLRTRFTNPKISAQTETEYFNKQSETNKQFLFAIIFVAAIMALGGVFGVMNTMFAAIAQRIKDIGVMRILGFKRWQILVSFLLESLAIALIGGVLGCLLGSLSDGASATSSISSGQGGGKTVILRLSVDSTVILTGLLFTLVMGRLGGLIPALGAMRLKILESLR
ncbi:MAG: ABC transporter permease [Gemmataceae bacterium]|nr:ABC transporter permease [Gemmataceae bacterium]